MNCWESSLQDQADQSTSRYESYDKTQDGPENPIPPSDSGDVEHCQMYPSKLASVCGAKIPNGWGLHDVHGNVREWCEDLYDGRGSNRVYRGGGWYDDADRGCRSAFRYWNSPYYRISIFVFRIALSPSVKQPEAKE